MTRISTRRPNRRDYDGGFAKVLAAATSNPKSASSHCQRNSKERELATKFFQKKSGAAHFADSLISMQQSSLGLKITENVSFNFASEASYIYIVDKSSLKMPIWRKWKKLNETFSVIFKQCEKVHFGRCHYYFSGWLVSSLYTRLSIKFWIRFSLRVKLLYDPCGVVRIFSNFDFLSL